MGCVTQTVALRMATDSVFPPVVAPVTAAAALLLGSGKVLSPAAAERAGMLGVKPCAEYFGHRQGFGKSGIPDGGNEVRMRFRRSLCIPIRSVLMKMCMSAIIATRARRSTRHEWSSYRLELRQHQRVSSVASGTIQISNSASGNCYVTDHTQVQWFLDPGEEITFGWYQPYRVSYGWLWLRISRSLNIGLASNDCC